MSELTEDLHPENSRQLERIQGEAGFRPTESFMNDYTVRLRMQHRMGVSGPLIAAQMISLCVKHKIKPPLAKKRVEQVADWSRVGRGTEVSVRTGKVATRQGFFDCIVTPGTLGVRFGDDRKVFQYPAHQVQVLVPANSDINKKDWKDDTKD